MPRRGKPIKRDTLEAFTERAKIAVDIGEGIPPIVYLPAKLRGHNMRVTVDQLRVTVDPPQVGENHMRIAQADPLGFLIAIMNGQPIPAFALSGEGDNTSVIVRYEVPSFEQRLNVGQWLATRVTYRPYNGRKPVSPQKEAHQAEYDVMIKQATEGQYDLEGSS
jgi:hypothetical protein